MTVYLHIGTHKTGTTAIQAFASKNREWLLSSGLLYPTPELIGGGPVQSHWRLVNQLAKGTDELRTDAEDLLHAARGKARELGVDIFISAENLYRLGKAEKENVLASLRTCFPSEDFVVVCALRPQGEFAESLYKNAYRVYKRVPLQIDAWLKASEPLFDYRARIMDFAGPLSAELALIPYARSGAAEFVQSFFARLGVESLEGSSEVGRKNLSLDTIDCLVKRRVMGEDTDPEASRIFNNFAASSKISSNYGFLDAEKERGFAQHFEAENEILIELEPDLASVLGAGTPRMERREFDDELKARVARRVQEFQDWVSVKNDSWKKKQTT